MLGLGLNYTTSHHELLFFEIYIYPRVHFQESELSQGGGGVTILLNRIHISSLVSELHDFVNCVHWPLELPLKLELGILNIKSLSLISF